jgi:hypothetical protein
MAVIVAEPAPTPVTLPVADTVATVGSVVAQMTDRPAIGLPASSRAVAVNCCEAPTRSVNSSGETVTDATGTETDTVALPLFPSDVAVIVAEPGPTPFTTPAAETVATVG